MITKIIYRLGIFAYVNLLRFAALFNPKAKKWLQGRKNIFKKIHEALQNNQAPLLWFHAASLGEFEQGRPVIEQLNALYPEKKIFLTFFSPSGYEVRKDYAQADYIFYLPIDTPRNAQRLLQLVQPEAVFFIKYEFWYFYLREVQKRGIPLILFSAVFRKEQFFFKSYGTLFKKLLQGYSHIFVQDQSSLELLQKSGIPSCSLAYDTRFDRVYATVQEARRIPLAEKFKNQEKLLVVGSCWGRDLDLLLPFINQFEYPLKVIIAPHEIKESTLQRIEKELTLSTIRFSQAQENQAIDAKVLIIDNIGMLSALYRYGEFAYVGGAFGEGLHNILEPATFGIPVFFGKDYAGYPEAFELIHRKGAHSVQDLAVLHQLFKTLYEDEDLRKNQGNNSQQYILEHCGGTQLIVNYYQNIANRLRMQ